MRPPSFLFPTGDPARPEPLSIGRHKSWTKNPLSLLGFSYPILSSLVSRSGFEIVQTHQLTGPAAGSVSSPLSRSLPGERIFYFLLCPPAGGPFVQFTFSKVADRRFPGAVLGFLILVFSLHPGPEFALFVVWRVHVFPSGRWTRICHSFLDNLKLLMFFLFSSPAPVL